MRTISVLLKPTFWQISMYSQSYVKILSLSVKEKNTFKAIEKYRSLASEKLYRNTLNKGRLSSVSSWGLIFNEEEQHAA